MTTIGEVFENLPLTERTFIKRLNADEYDFTIDNEAHPCEYDLLREGKRFGMVKYYKGRKLCCYTIGKGEA